MAPNKFEKHIKKQLEEREIQPSSDAWMKLSDQLEDVALEQPKKRGYFWYTVAACLIGLLIFSTFFFNSKTSISESHIQVVEDEKKAIDEVDDFQKIEIQRNVDEVVSTERIPEEKTNVEEVRSNVEATKKETFTKELAEPSNDFQMALNDSSEEIINTKVLQVLAQVDALEQDSSALTDAEVDSLLRKAQNEILSDKLFREDHSVDAMALLSEVEDELDKSFRDQIFESLKSGFLKVRTAVADRNN